MNKTNNKLDVKECKTTVVRGAFSEDKAKDYPIDIAFATSETEPTQNIM